MLCKHLSQFVHSSLDSLVSISIYNYAMMITWCYISMILMNIVWQISQGNYWGLLFSLGRLCIGNNYAWRIFLKVFINTHDPWVKWWVHFIIIIPELVISDFLIRGFTFCEAISGSTFNGALIEIRNGNYLFLISYSCPIINWY